MATVAFSHFYKIPLVPKVTKFIFYNNYIFFSIDDIIPKIVLVRQKYIFFEKKLFFEWKTKNDKKN